VTAEARDLSGNNFHHYARLHREGKKKEREREREREKGKEGEEKKAGDGE